MAKAPASDTRDVMEIDWAFFGEVCRALALKVAREFDPEVVLGIAKAGVMPGVVVASILQREFASMVVTRPSARTAPVLVAGPLAEVREQILRLRAEKRGATRSVSKRYAPAFVGSRIVRAA